MYLRKTVRKKNGKKYEYWRVVVSFRDKKRKVLQKTIRNLGKLTNEEVLKWRLFLSVKSLEEIVIAKWEDIKIKSVREGISVAVLHNLWVYWGLRDLICSLLDEKTQNVAGALVINRCVHPDSDYKVSSWYNKTLLPFIQAKEELNPTEIYRTLDKILEIEKEIQVHLYKRIKELGLDEFNLVFYDLTSTYFEGNGPPLATFGHSRDKRGDKPQIILAIAVTKKGFPFWWKVFSGNTVDSQTLIEIVSSLKEQFNLNECALVVDKGIVTDKNLDSLEKEGYSFVSTISRSKIRSLKGFPFEFLKTINESNLSEKLSYFDYYNKRAYYKELGVISDRRYILCFNPEKFIEERHNRKEKLSSIEKYFEKLNIELENAKYNRDKEKLRNKIYYYLKRRDSLRFFNVEVGDRIKYSISRVKKEEVLDGVYVLCSNLMEPSCKELISAYRNRIKIECAFHHIKSFVDVRPIYHHLNKRVRAHILICMLGYLLNLTFEHFIRDELEDMTGRKIYEELEKEDACEIEVNGVSRMKLKEPSPFVHKALRILSSHSVVGMDFLSKLRAVM
ncbi:MAG: IS1634 family transposase [Candidatus Thermoplasmatota archaeon]|nr:IS1634 family transposase [Candidatus Thermoplasmatota archaeon]